jgi:RimJ/RimL family protein N-acetyltransferase/nucleotide-binding universal stress UspA family protein
LTDGKSERTPLRDGSTVRIRAIEPEDRELLRASFERLSERARYMRFQSPVTELSDRQLSYLTDVDHHDHEALVALDPDTGEGVGVARFVRVNDAVAECAIVVADDWQGRGVATHLLDRLVDRAREEGIERFTALLLAENNDALRLLERLGQSERRRVGSQVELDIELPAAEQPSPQLKLVLTGVARGLLVPAISMWRQVADFAYRRTEPPAEPANVIVAHAYAAHGEAPAVNAAAGLAGPRRAHVHLVETYWPVLSDRRALDDRLSSAADELSRNGIAVTAHLAAGDTADALIDVAEETRAALIVLDPRAATPLMPWRAYSLPARVCARAPCDVLIARQPR